MADQQQLEVIRQGETEWKHWRTENPDVVPDLRKADLHKANLTMADLSSAEPQRGEPRPGAPQRPAAAALNNCGDQTEACRIYPIGIEDEKALTRPRWPRSLRNRVWLHEHWH